MNADGAPVADEDSSEKGSRSVLQTDVQELIRAHPGWALAFYSVLAAVAFTVVWMTDGPRVIVDLLIFGFGFAVVVNTVILLMVRARRR
jgi:hypothetical protein